MSSYVRTETVEAMWWDAVLGSPALIYQGQDLESWVLRESGEARFEIMTNGPRIVIRTSTGLAYAAPGDWIVMGERRMKPGSSTHAPSFRAFRVVDAASFEREGWQPA